MYREATEDDFAPRPALSAPAGPAGFFEIVGASWDAERIETDWHNYMGRRYQERYDQAWSAVRDAMGEEAALQALRDRGLRTDRIQGRATITSSPRHQAAILEMAGGLAQDLYGPFPSSREALLEEVNAEVRAEYEDAAATLSMGRAGSGLAEFLGRGGAAMTDEVSLMTLPFGAGAGSVARVMLTEAALGAAAEAAILPRMYEQQERVGTPEPNPLAQIGMGAVLGGALGGVGEGLRRALIYSQIRRQIAALPDGMSVPEAQAMVEAATEALEAGRPLPEAIQREEGPQVPFALRDDEDAALVPDMGEPVRIPTEDEIEAERRRIVRENPELGRNRPTLDFIRQAGGIQWTRVNPNTGERELTPIAAELQGMGISQRQLLGIVRRDGMADIDNLPASEFADGGTPRLRTADDALYVDRDALIEAIVQEATGQGPAYRTAEAEVAAAQLRDLEDSFALIRREMDSVADAEGVPEMDFADDYLDPPRDGKDGLARAQVAEDALFRHEEGLSAPLPGAVRDRAMIELADRGGSVEDAIQRAWMDYIEEISDGNARLLEARAAEAMAADDPNAGAGRADRTAAAGVGGDAAVAAGRSEQTPAGDQLLTPGTAPVSQRQRLEAQQNAPLRGGDAIANDGLFDLNARLQRDMFDDPDNASMQAKYDEREAEMREAWDGLEDVAVELEGETVTARQLLRDLEGDRAHLQAIETCGWTGRGGPDVVS